MKRLISPCGLGNSRFIMDVRKKSSPHMALPCLLPPAPHGTQGSS